MKMSKKMRCSLIVIAIALILLVSTPIIFVLGIPSCEIRKIRGGAFTEFTVNTVGPPGRPECISLYTDETKLDVILDIYSEILVRD